jgi:hypothetical protein
MLTATLTQVLRAAAWARSASLCGLSSVSSGKVVGRMGQSNRQNKI